LRQTFDAAQRLLTAADRHTLRGTKSHAVYGAHSGVVFLRAATKRSHHAAAMPRRFSLMPVQKIRHEQAAIARAPYCPHQRFYLKSV